MGQTPFRRALLVANPIAGRGRAQRQAEVLSRELERAGIENELAFTAGRGDGLERARSASGIDLAVSIGGDGTLREVLEGLYGRDVPVAVLPLGTANVMSLDLGLPQTVSGLVEIVRRGRTKALDVARVNGSRLSFLVTSVGFDASAVHQVEASRRGAITKGAYLRAAWRALARHRDRPLAVEVDGEELPGRCAMVLVSNVIHYGGYKVLSSDCRIDDGFYEVYLFAKGSRASLVRVALRAAVLGLPGGSCTRVRAKRVRIASEEPAPCQVDGDAFGATPVEIAVDPVQSRLVVP